MAMYLKIFFFLTLLCLAVPFWMLIATIQNFNLDNTYKLMSAMENFIQPVALVIIIFFVAKPLNRLERLSLLRIASITIILMLCLNSILSILTIFYDTWPFLQYFTMAGKYLENSIGNVEVIHVSQLSTSGGRYSGVFSQPAEAGLAYSIAIIVWVYLATTCKRITSIGWLSLGIIIIGGSLTISKTFILGGFPLAMLYWFWRLPKSIFYS